MKHYGCLNHSPHGPFSKNNVIKGMKDHHLLQLKELQFKN